MAVDLAPALALLRREAAEIAALYLFGSAAAGAERPDSDVDLVDLACAPARVQMQPIGEGRLIAAYDAHAAAFFEVRAMREHQDLKARRASIEAHIIQRGRVYAG